MAKVRKVKNGEVAELVESTTLLTWQGLIALAGSNPALSALYRMIQGSAFREWSPSYHMKTK